MTDKHHESELICYLASGSALCVYMSDDVLPTCGELPMGIRLNRKSNVTRLKEKHALLFPNFQKGETWLFAVIGKSDSLVGRGVMTAGVDNIDHKIPDDACVKYWRIRTVEENKLVYMKHMLEG